LFYFLTIRALTCQIGYCLDRDIPYWASRTTGGLPMYTGTNNCSSDS